MISRRIVWRVRELCSLCNDHVFNCCAPPPQLRRHVVIALRHQPRRFWSRLYFISLYSTTMPSELLHAPPLYTLVGIYRLLTDPQIRGPVLDKVKHASVRGLIVGLIYAIVSWRPLRWFIKRFLVGGEWTLFGFRKVKEVVEEHGNGKVKFRGIEFDIVLCMSEPLVDSDDRYPPIDIVTANIKHPSFLRIQEPQASSVESICIDSGITSKTSSILESSKCPTTSSDKADTKGYIEEWANPPRAVSGEVANGHSAGPKWISWILWWPTMLVLKHCQSSPISWNWSNRSGFLMADFLIPLSPTLPLISPLFVSFLRSITTAEYLHQPYFETKGMSRDEVWRWVEERKWAYRGESSTLRSCLGSRHKMEQAEADR